MKARLCSGPGMDWICSGPLCFHGFKHMEKVFALRGYHSKVTGYICEAWGEMIPN